MIGKPRDPLAGYPGHPRPGAAARITDHQNERPLSPAEAEAALKAEVAAFPARDIGNGVALQLMAPLGSVPSGDLDPDAEIAEPWTIPFVEMAKQIRELRERIEIQPPDAQFARSLLEFGERLTRIEKQIAFMSSAQAMQEKQMSLHKRATALDLAIKACGQVASAGDLTSIADAFVIWLDAGVMG